MTTIGCVSDFPAGGKPVPKRVISGKQLTPDQDQRHGVAGGIEEFDESIPTRRFRCSISASSTAITASRSARAASNSSRLSSSGPDTHPNYGSPGTPAMTTETGRVYLKSDTGNRPEWILRKLSDGARAAVCYPAPLNELTEARPDDQGDADWDKAVAALQQVWARLGFEHFRDGVHILDLSLVTLDEKLESLRKDAERYRTVQD